MTQLEITDIGTDSEDKDVPGDSPERFVAIATGETLDAQADSLRQVLAAVATVTDVGGLGAAERSDITRRIANRDVDSLPLRVEGGMVSCGPSASEVMIDGAIEYADRNEIAHLFVDSFATLGESHGVIGERVREAVEGGVTPHIVSRGLDVTAENADAVLGVLDGLDDGGLELQRRADVRDVQRWLPDTARAGRPPLGLDKVDGELTPGENFDEVRAVISMRLNDDISQRKAAERLGVSPRTIVRAEENADRYGLEDTEE